ncbi:hypothetical protein CMK22_19245 [Candidatus Poribacteria bacterium]|nr:hypothetical protein [Candidatus Poribacteria bacterium]
MTKYLLAVWVLIPLVLNTGCMDQPGPTPYELGRDKLLGSGLTIEAIEHLRQSEGKRERKVEPRGLLLIAYYNAITTGDAGTQGKSAEFGREKEKRLNELNNEEIYFLIDILGQRHGDLQKDLLQIFIDKIVQSPDKLEILISAYQNERYDKAHPELNHILEETGLSEPIVEALDNPEFSEAIKLNFLQIVGKINDLKIIPKLEMQKKKSSGTVKASIVSVLYQLGKKEYKSDILVNLSDDNPAIRLSAARTLSMFEEPATKEMLISLKDSSGQVRTHAVEALTKFPTKDAVNMLLDILYNDAYESAKQSAINALVAHADNGLAKGLAKTLVNQLHKTEVPKDRLRIIAILRAERLRRQIKANPYDNLEFQLSEFFQKEEGNDMVKAHLSKLLNDLDAS